MANQACMVFNFFFCSSPGILRQPLHLARERETFWYLFYLCTSYGSRVSLFGEEEEERKKRKKEYDDFRFFQNSFTQLLYSWAEIRGHFCTQEGQGFQWIFILLAKPTNHMPFYPCLLYCQNISTTLIPT